MEQTSNIQYTINGINYVLVSYQIATEYMRQKLTERMKRHDAILQSGRINKSFWKTYVMCNILVPETNLIAFNLDDIK